MQERTVVIIGWLKNIVFMILIFFIGMVFDYCRIITVVDKRRNIIFSLFKSLYIIVRYIHKTFAIYYLLAFIGFILIVVYSISEHFIPQNTMRSIAIAFAVQQFYLLLKLYLRCTFFSTQMSFYKGVQSFDIEEIKREVKVPENLEVFLEENKKKKDKKSQEDNDD